MLVRAKKRGKFSLFKFSCSTHERRGYHLGAASGVIMQQTSHPHQTGAKHARTFLDQVENAPSVQCMFCELHGGIAASYIRVSATFEWRPKVQLSILSIATSTNTSTNN